MPISINIYTSKILYQSNRNRLTYHSISDDGYRNKYKNEYDAFKRYKG